MSEQPEPLRLADAIDPLTRKELDNLTCSAAATELRRLHEVNQELLEALVDAERFIPVMDRKKARAAIAKATGESNV